MTVCLSPPDNPYKHRTHYCALTAPDHSPWTWCTHHTARLHGNCIQSLLFWFGRTALSLCCRILLGIVRSGSVHCSMETYPQSSLSPPPVRERHLARWARISPQSFWPCWQPQHLSVWRIHQNRYPRTGMPLYYGQDNGVLRPVNYPPFSNSILS